jgi:hypothetical protein
MTDRQREETRAYSVSVTFRSGGEPFASESFEVHAIDEFDAERRARDVAGCSPCYNERIPDLDVTVMVASPAGPEDDPPTPVARSPAPARGSSNWTTAAVLLAISPLAF